MVYTLKDRIFGFFGLDDKVRDTFKDGQGKGINERFNEALGEDYDENLGPLVDNLMDNTIVPQTMLVKFLPVMESMLGDLPVMIDDENIRRKTIEFFTKLYSVKGTALSYVMLFTWMGFDTVVVTEFSNNTSFDSSFTLDDSFRTFDATSSGCSQYSIILTGSLTLDSAIIAGMALIIEFLEPIYVKLKEIIYNGSPIQLLISVQIIDGRLIFDLTNDPGVTFTLVDGVLFSNGINQGNYQIVDGRLFLI